MNPINTQIAEALARIRREKPLIHHITNLVVMNDTANVTLHVGALPVMAHAVEEVAETTRTAQALVLNLGTPTASRVEAMFVAGREANRAGIPIVMDPVGAGATPFRTQTGLRLLETLRVAVVRGNAGEIGSLSGAGGRVRGVESVAGGGNPVTLARDAASAWDAVVTISGKQDVVSDGAQTWGVDNGHPWLTTLTGTGCMATTLIAAFAAVERDYLLAALGGMACLGLAAELAAGRAGGPASFKVALFDRLYHLSPEQLAAGARLVRLS